MRHKWYREIILTTFAHLDPELLYKWPEIKRFVLEHAYSNDNIGSEQLIDRIDCVVRAAQWRPEYLIKRINA